ncbi:unnamed protein product [Rotaria sp. Silwood1]|nr:unnamed protein product [Rotaria sp. Silwood1]CAF3822513.1 unnamed protein product [Rotaria sp. Silwood1]CAF3829650.1 unnamed protein product [Rotaria sp. Silwood1]CAF5115500.1 unnamed protein product [Rotaria sp. Silwood1]
METVHLGLPVERIDGACEFEINDLKCNICKNVLWQPIACKNCEIAFCSTCINQWLAENSGICRNDCREFVQRQCPRLIVQQLSRLHFKCENSPHGCEQVVPYDDLEKHELECQYKPLECRGCHATVLKMNYTEHDNSCEEIQLICPECNMTYKRGEAATVHTEIICLKEQLRQLRKDFEGNKQQTGEQIQQVTEKMQQLPEAIQQLQQTSETNKQQASEEIQRIQQSFEVYKQQTGDEIHQIQQTFQTNKEKSNNGVEHVIKRLERE